MLLARSAEIAADPSSRSFAELLREYRHAAGLTQEQLAERAKLSPRTLRKLESGASRVPRRDTMLLLADALDLGEQHSLLLQASVRRSSQSYAARTTLPATLLPDPQYHLALVEAMRFLALLAIHLGQLAESGTFREERPQLARAIPPPYTEGSTMPVRGDRAATRGEWEVAHERYQAALAILGRLEERLFTVPVERMLERANQN